MILPPLTGLAAEIAGVIGAEATFRLLMRRGGTEIKMPAEVEGSLLEELIGTEAAEALAAHFGAGLEFQLPCANLRGAGGRRALGAAMLLRGASQMQVALACDVHLRTVAAWRKSLARQGVMKGDRDGRQLRLL